MNDLLFQASYFTCRLRGFALAMQRLTLAAQRARASMDAWAAEWEKGAGSIEPDTD